MSKLYFKIASDWEEVVRLRNEVAKLKQELKGINSTQSPATFKALNTQLSASTQRMNELITNAAKAGAVIEGDFRKKIFDASQTINGFTEKIIAQKNAIGSLQTSIRKNKELYRTITSRGNEDKGLLNHIREQEKALGKERDALFNLTQAQANARLSVKKLRDEYSLYKNDGKQVVETNRNIGLSLGKALGVIGGVAALKRLGSEIIRVRGEFQSMQTAIETMVGKDIAGKLIPQIKELAKISPLTMSDMVGAEKMMLGFNIQAEDTIKYLKALSDISMGESSKFNSLTLAFSQMSAAGKLMGQDLNQMINAGFNPLQTIAEKTGKSIATLKNEMSKGAISAEMVQQAFLDATSAGGKFYNMSENASKTINGQLSMMHDALDNAFNEIGKASEGVIMKGIQTTTSLILNYEQVGKVLTGLIVVYGTYKTALFLAMEAEKGYTIAQSLNIKVTLLAEKAQKALNLAVLKNPYVLAAVAVVGLVSAMWAFHDSTTAAEKAQKRFNEEKEQSIKQEQEHKQKLEELVSAIQSEYTSSLDRVKAMDLIKENYPSIFRKYIDEKGHIRDLISLWKEYNEEVSRGKVTENKKNYTDSKTLIDEYQKIIGLWNKFGNDPNFHKNALSAEEKTLADKYKNDTLSTLKSKLDEEKQILVTYQKEVRADELAQWQLDLKKKTDVQIKSELDEMKRIQHARKNNPRYSLSVGVGSLKGMATESELQQRIAILESEYNIKKRGNSSYKEDYEKAKKAWEDAKKALAEIEKDKSKFTTQQYEEAKKLKESTEKAYKDLGGITGSSLTKQENQAEKLRKEQEKYNLLVDKQELERIRKAEDLEIQLAQTTIDAMSDGFEKEQAQRELNNKKELQALERQKEDYIRAYIQAEREKFNANPANKGKTFNPSSVKVDASKWDAIIENTKTNQGLNEWERREEAMNEYLLKYGTFSQKKEAIDKKYRAAIDKEVDLGKKNSLQKEWDEALTNLDLSKLKEEINWEMIFGDLSKVTKEQLRNIKKQLQEFKNSPEFQKATPEQIEVIESAFNSINNALVDKGGFFGGMVDSVTELKLATEELKKAEEELAEANKKGSEAQKEEAQKKVNAAKKKKQNAEVNATKSSDKTIQHLTAVGNAIAELGSTAEMSLSSFGNAVGSIVDAFSDAGEKIGGIIGAAFSVLEGIQKQGLDGFIGNVLENVAGAIGGIWDTLTFGAFGLKGADYSRYNEMVAQYETINSIWDELIDKKQKYIDISYGIEASKAGKEAASIQRKAMENYRTLGVERLNSGASAGSHSIGRRIWRDMSNEGWTQAQQALGSDWEDSYRDKSRMTWLFDLTSKQLETLKEEAPTFWAKLDGDVRDYLNNIIAGEEKIQEIQNQVKEQLTQTSFDNVFDSFLDTLMDMDSAAEDFSKDFEEYMKRAVLTNMLGSEYEKQLQDWYDNFAKAMDEKRERGKFLRPGKVIEEAGVLTEEEQAELQKQWDAIVSGALDRRNQLASAMGWESESTREASQKGIATASQDSIDELRGTMTNVQGHTYNINENTARIATGINTLTEHTKHLTCLADIDNTMQSLLTMRKESIEHLSNIAEYTSNLVEMKEFMRSMKTGIDTLNTKGLTLKR